MTSTVSRYRRHDESRQYLYCADTDWSQLLLLLLLKLVVVGRRTRVMAWRGVALAYLADIARLTDYRHIAALSPIHGVRVLRTSSS